MIRFLKYLKRRRLEQAPKNKKHLHESIYKAGDWVSFFDYTPRQYKLVNSGKVVKKKAKEGWIAAVLFDCNEAPLYMIQDFDGKMSIMNVSENHIVKLITE